MAEQQSRLPSTLWRIFAVSLALVLAYTASDVLLLIFAAVLLSILLRSAACALHDRTGMSTGLSIGFILVGIAGLASLAGWHFAAQLGDQADQLAERIPHAWDNFQGQMRDALGDGPVDELKDQISNQNRLSDDNVMPKVFDVASWIPTTIGGAVLIFFLSLYLAIAPGIYRQGFVRLLPVGRRRRAEEVMLKVGDTLLWWLIGKLISMLVVGVLTFLGLWLLSIPFALSLSLIACALTFVPNFGPIVSAIPAVLLAMTDGVWQVAWVIGLYLAVQTVESYLITPLVQQRTVSLPPALTISSQLIAGALIGAAGLALATPMTAAIMVLVQELYIKDKVETGGLQNTGAAGVASRPGPHRA